MTKLERLEKAVVDTKSDTTAAAYANLAANSVLDDAIAAQKRAKQELTEYLKEQQDNAANAAYDTLRKSVLGRDYKLEQDK